MKFSAATCPPTGSLPLLSPKTGGNLTPRFVAEKFLRCSDWPLGDILHTWPRLTMGDEF